MKMDRKILFGLIGVLVLVLGTSTMALAADRKDPYPRSSFLVEIDGITIASFASIEGVGSEVEVVEYREGNEPPTVRLQPGIIRTGSITLRLGVTDNMELYKWYELVEEGKMDDARRNMAIILMDREGNPTARWEFENCWPSAYYVKPLNSTSREVTYEVLVVQYEGMARAG